jgi:hypothetical protein
VTAESSAASGGAALSDGPLRFLPRAIREPDRPVRAALVGWATAFIPAVLLGVLLALVAPQAETPKFPFTGVLGIFMLGVFAPVLETLVMGAVLLILLRFLAPTVAIIVSAVGWASLHSLEVPIWGLVIWWPFLIFSTVFVTWRERSLLAAFGMAALVHGLNNFLPALPVAYPQYFPS